MRCVPNQRHAPAGQLAAARKRAAVGYWGLEQLRCGALHGGRGREGRQGVGGLQQGGLVLCV